MSSSGGKKAYLDVPDARVQLGGGEDEGNREMLVCRLLSDQFPGQLRHKRIEQVCGLRLSQEQYARARYPSFRHKADMLEELLVAPAFDRLGRDTRGVFLGERPAGDRHRLLGEVGDLCVLNDLRRPVKQMPLAANRIELADGEVGEVLAGAGVPVPLPGDRHALRGGGDLEHHDAPVRMVHHSDASKRHAGVGIVVDLLF